MALGAPTSADRATSALRDLIFDGELPAGSDHLESELARRLGMSRTPIREAALRLAAQGLIELRPRKGVRILPLAPRDMREIYEVLTELESLAAARAARAGHPPQALAGLAAAIDDMDRALNAGDRLAWAEADDRFHVELVRLGGNARIVSIAAMMSDQVRRARRVTLFMRPPPVRSNDDHRAVLDAIARGDADAAQRLHHAHRSHASKMLTALLETHRLKRV
ncbi:MAG: GntR family transcriptional regulator [Rhodobacteraceae bacterium]|nr:GntR family transcriptional regulator [Paracoccaceae bacterium]